MTTRVARETSQTLRDLAPIRMTAINEPHHGSHEFWGDTAPCAQCGYQPVESLDYVPAHDPRHDTDVTAEYPVVQS